MAKEEFNPNPQEKKTDILPDEPVIIADRSKLDKRALKLNLDLNDMDEVEKAVRKNPQTALDALKTNTEAAPRLTETARTAHDKINKALTGEMKKKVNESIGKLEVSTLMLAKAKVNPKTVRAWLENLRNLHKLGFSALHNAYPGVTDHWLARIGNLLVNSAVSYWVSKGMSAVYEETGHAETMDSQEISSKIGGDRERYIEETEKIEKTASKEERVRLLQKQYDDYKELSIGKLFLSSMTTLKNPYVSIDPASRKLNDKENAALLAAGPNQHGILTRERVEEYQKRGHFHVMDSVYFLRELMYSPGYTLESITSDYLGDPYNHMKLLIAQGKTPDLQAIADSEYERSLKQLEEKKPLTNQEKAKLKEQIYKNTFQSISPVELKKAAAFQLAQVITGMIDPAKALADYLIFGKENSELLHIKLPGGIKVYAPKLFTWMNESGYSASVDTAGKIGDKIYVKAGGEAAFIGDDKPEATLGAEYRGERIRADAEVTMNPKFEHYVKTMAGARLWRELSVFGEFEASQGTMRGKREFPRQGVRGQLGLRYEF